MPLPLILPAVPSPPQSADIVLVSAVAASQPGLGGQTMALAEPGLGSIAPADSAAAGAVSWRGVSQLSPLLLATDDGSEPLVAEPATIPLDPAESPTEGREGTVDVDSQPLDPAPAEPESGEFANPQPENSEPASSELEDTDVPGETELPAAGVGSILLRADRQEFEPLRQIVTATGDVLVQFGTGQLAADRLWANLVNRHLRAEGNVFFNRNNQIIEGETATYNLLQGAGTITESRGELEVSTLEDDFSTDSAGLGQGANLPLDYRLQSQPSISQATSPGGIGLATGDSRLLVGTEQGTIERLRFEAGQLSFDADGWYAEQVRLTNDPFSPPELEFRANSVRLTPLNEVEEELVFENPRLVFNQGLSIPLFRNRFILTRGQLPAEALNPLPTGIGIDGRDRGGLYVEAPIPLNIAGPLNLTIAPQFFVSRWLGDSNYNIADPANFGLAARVDGPVGPRTQITGALSLAGFDLANFSERLRASFRARQLLGTHRLNLEYSYRDRLFNGSLGFQDVQNTIGALLESPVIALGNSGIDLTYQVSGQYVTANTDRADLLDPGEGIGLTSLFRFQSSANFTRNFLLWQGQPLPATPTEGLRYSPRPLVPNLVLGVGLRGGATYYTSNDLQETLETRVVLAGQLGRLRRRTFDYTQFNIGFSRTLIGGDTSPFLFDRTVDQNVLSGGIIQQLYGPFLAGFQTSLNVDSGRIIDSNLIFEYRRRAYGLLLTYSPTQETGFLGFRISGFDWEGRTAPFDSPPDTPSDVIVQ
ncbi:DUF3769 domain-containing protein [Leptolyngbya sp. CCNP1308]|uniref:DUF3769 domain-containing protein n=1 Tax=Leptolyngbya sp. CCNP1308 TaxID=3110255 RepID=UPI002B214DAE|nr:DUF3769 domain-containing protein [Leptolyngbya sp. CCNP1308]MEA5450571.1 DUF3769 domain-containing protein [Leptolyngbya sp. CCNP1308]